MGKSKTLLYGQRQPLVHVKTDDIYKDIVEDVETRFGTSSYEVNRPLHMGKNKKFIGLRKDELGEKIIKKFVGLRPKTYSYQKDINDEYKKAKGTKKCIAKRKLNFRIIKVVQKLLKL